MLYASRFEQSLLLMFRHAAQADLEPLLAFLKANHLVLAGVEDHLEHFFVRLEEGSIVASAGLEVYGHAALLRSVAVSPRHTGEGTRLVQHLLEYAGSLGVDEVLLLTETAKGFFAKLGFQETARETAPEALRNSLEFRGACPDSAVLMWRNLT